MHLVTSRQMANIDQRTIEEHGIPGIDLMRRAGRAVVNELVDRSGNMIDDTAAILCGSGNNGGDGFVVAKYLDDLGAKPTVWVLADPAKIRGDARLALDEWTGSGGEITVLSTDDEVKTAAESWRTMDFLVDAMLGTGLSGEVRGVIHTAIEEIAGLRLPIVAIDIPSGVSGDTGEVLGIAVKASLTVTFGLPKVGQAFYPGKRHCGTLTVRDIGLAPEAVESEAGDISLTGQSDAASWLPERAPEAHKGDAGKALIVAGSVGMTGAAALAGESAMRAGAGLVYLACPESLNDILEAKLTEVITLPVPEVRKPRCLSTRALGEIVRRADGMNALAIGPGLGRHRETMELVRRFAARCEAPLVIDADGLFALDPALCPVACPVVLTPHYGEFARLFRKEIADVAARPLEHCREAAGVTGATILLKGAPTVVCGPSGECWVNPTGNPGMATAGSGDVLTGLITGLIAQGVEPERAARLGAYLHGAAGDDARDELGVYGMLAGDILRHLPTAMRKIARASG